MTRFSYTGCLFAVAFAASGIAHGQQACESDIQQLESRLQERQIDQQTRMQVQELLEAAASASDQDCQQIVTEAGEQLDAAQSAQGPQVAAAQGAQQSQQPQSQQPQSQQAQSQQPQESARQPTAQTERSAGQDQDTTQVQVEQPAAEVRVDPASPQVNVQQPAPEVTVEQPAPQVRITQPDPEVTVRQREPEVEVQQAEPEVTVEQADPRVTVRQPDPEVTVVQPEPEITVDQAEPDVEVSQAQPDVDVSQAEPEVQVQQAEPEVSVAEQDSAREQSEQTEQQVARSTAELDAEELVGNNIVARDSGEDIGEITGLARSRSDGDLYALVDVGGFLGIGERTVALPVDRVEMDRDGDLMTQITREELEQMPEYDAQEYASIEDESRVLR